MYAASQRSRLFIATPSNLSEVTLAALGPRVGGDIAVVPGDTALVHVTARTRFPAELLNVVDEQYSVLSNKWCPLVVVRPNERGQLTSRGVAADELRRPNLSTLLTHLEQAMRHGARSRPWRHPAGWQRSVLRNTARTRPLLGAAELALTRVLTDPITADQRT